MSDVTTTDADSGDLALLQRRVALLGLVGSAFGAFSLSVTFAQFAHNDPSWRGRIFLGMAVIVMLVSWLVCRKGQRSVRFVRAVEVVMTISCVACFDAMAIGLPLYARPDAVATLCTAFAVIARAVLVPSSGRRTAILSALLCMPLVAVAFVVHSSSTSSWTGAKLSVSDAVADAILWAVLSCGLATIASSVIYGLRRQVRKAMELGQYTLLEKLGEGGMGQVFRAQHAMLRRPTAVKLLHSSTPADLARFEREVQLTAQLTHPNTITVFDYGKTPDGVFYYAMELLEGSDLQNLVEREGAMPAGRVIHILAQVADALAEAHEVGLIHRDIKPANIILCARGTALDVAKVVDFGLVKSTGRTDAAELGASAPNAVLGTPLYMAPETIRDPEVIDARADLYALGAVGYFLLTGTPVFPGSSIAAILGEHLHAKPIPPHERLGVVVPPDLEAIILTCLAKEAAYRPPSALAVRDLLRMCVDATSWTQSDAQAWWRAHAAKKHAAKEVWSAKTISVDLTQRGAATVSAV